MVVNKSCVRLYLLLLFLYKVKFFLCLIKYHIVKAYSRMKTLLHVFLNSTQDISE